jgi:hypothetical protein
MRRPILYNSENKGTKTAIKLKYYVFKDVFNYFQISRLIDYFIVKMRQIIKVIFLVLFYYKDTLIEKYICKM